MILYCFVIFQLSFFSYFENYDSFPIVFLSDTTNDYYIENISNHDKALEKAFNDSLIRIFIDKLPQATELEVDDYIGFYENITPLGIYFDGDIKFCAVLVKTGAGGYDDRIYLNSYDKKGNTIESLLVYSNRGCDIYGEYIHSKIYKESIYMKIENYECYPSENTKPIFEDEENYRIENGKFIKE